MKARRKRGADSSERAVRILVTLLHPGYARNYEDVLRGLLARGYRIHIAMLRKSKSMSDRFAERLGEEYPNISVSVLRSPGRDGWQNVVWAVRTLADYARYLHPRYRHAKALRERVIEKLYTGRAEVGFPLAAAITLFVAVLGRFRGARYSNLLVRALLRIERTLPVPDLVTKTISDFQPDLVVSSPYLSIGSSEADYLRAARRLGIRTALFVASWDNLTNKGLVKIQPDRVFVWNEIQRREAAELHGLDPESVVVTGAQRFDGWFEQRPRWSRAEFCELVGLAPEKPYVIYLCSSPFIAPDEVPFVERLLERLRRDDSPLRDVGVLVRPHPQNAKQWADADLRPFGGAVIWPPAGEPPVDEVSRAGFYDSMFHSAAVVGINTSALIEAGIVGRTVHTVLDDGFSDTQEGTLHFHYLLEENGGHLHVADSMDSLVDNLARAVNGEIDHEQTQRFIELFVRPRGLDRPATPIFVDAVEELTRIPKPEPEEPSAGDRLITALLTPLVLLSRPLPPVRKWKLLPQRRVPEAQAPVQPRSPLVDVRKEVRRVALYSKKRSAIVAVGPWLHDAGSEILYWIPFLRWATQNYDLEPSNLIAISRGGNKSWYRNVCDGYLDLLHLVDFSVYRQASRSQAFAETDGEVQTQGIVELVEAYVAENAGGRVMFLRPSAMHRALSAVWAGSAPMRAGESVLDMRRLRAGADPALERKLPPRFVAVQFGFTPAFPSSPSNVAAIEDLIDRIAAKMPVVVLDPPLGERTSPFEITARKGVVRLIEDLEPTQNLAVQTFAISRSQGFVGTYGSLCQVAAAHGVPSVGLYSEGQGLRPVDIDWTEQLVRLTDTEFSLMHVDAVDLVGRMLGSPAGGLEPRHAAGGASTPGRQGVDEEVPSR